MDTSRIIARCNGVRLAAKGDANLAKTGYYLRLQVAPPMNWLEKMIATEDDLKIFSVALAYEDLYLAGVDRLKAESLFSDWKARYLKPSIILDEFSISSPSQFAGLFRETVTGPPLLSLLRQRQIHFMTFAYLVSMVGGKLPWRGVHYRIVEKKIKTLLDALPSLHQTPALSGALKNSWASVDETPIIV